MKTTWYLVLLTLLLQLQTVISQIKFSISGTVTDSSSNEYLSGVNIIAKNTFKGTNTDHEGKFNFQFNSNSPQAILIFSLIGYNPIEIPVLASQQTLNVALGIKMFEGKEIVISASRISESIMQSPSQVQKMNSRDIKEIPSIDYLDGLNELTGVDITTSSFGFKSVNVRGFNAGFNYRTPILIDGIDNQSPGLNFPLGNLFGPQETDLDNIEVISGPASALYGPNAFLGVISMKTKSAFEYPGIQIKLQGGEQNFKAGEIRFAENFTKSNCKLLQERLGIKFTAAFLKADEFATDDAIKYGKITTSQDIDAIVNQLQYSPDSTTALQFKGINQYLSIFPNAKPGVQTITSPGYSESELTDRISRNFKLGGSVAYKLNTGLTASYDFHHMQGDALFSTFTRIQLKNATFNEHKIELTGKHFFVRGYAVFENAGDSYGLDFTGSYLSTPYFYPFINNYINSYFTTLAQQTNNYSQPPSAANIKVSQETALLSGNTVWLHSGTNAFDSLSNLINANPHLSKGAKFQDQSSMMQFEGQYNFNFSFADIIAGASFRKYFPRSYGTLFIDTLINKADTLITGEPNPDGAHADITSYETGGYVQAIKKLLDDKLKLTGSIRIDKSQNYTLQFSPRLSVVYTYQNHTFRFSAQTAFRSPDQFDQYALIDFGFITRAGNLHGYQNAYTQESVSAFQTHYLTTGIADASLLKNIILNPVTPEHVKALEFGYRAILNGNIYTDISTSISAYDDFIGLRTIIIPQGSAIAGDSSGFEAIKSGQIKSFSVPSNAHQQTLVYQSAIGLQYYLNDRLTLLANYSYSTQSNINNITDPLVPAYNTPPNEFGLGLRGRKIYKKFGFYVFGKWMDGYTFTTGTSPYQLHSRRIINAQISYDLKNQFTSLKIGVTNLLDEKYDLDSPRVGRMLFASLTFDWH